MLFCSWYTLLLVFPLVIRALPVPRIQGGQTIKHRSVTLPIRRWSAKESLQSRDDGVTASVGIGDLADLFYTVSVELGETTTALNLDTGSSDLWVMSDDCHTDVCQSSITNPYSPGSSHPTGASVHLQFGDSTTGTHAIGPIVQDTVALAGLAMVNQTFVAVNDTDNSAVQNGGAGIFGLGFPSQSFVQAAVINAQFNSPAVTDDFVLNTATDGPLVPRLAMSGHIEQPLFAITLQRNMIDVSGHGQITIGELPDGIDNSSITWVPVRLYSPEDGGQNPPTFAPNEIYPLRWEVPLEGVFLNGERLPDTSLTGNSPTVSALIDTGNSLLRGPEDVVDHILQAVSPAFAQSADNLPTYPCDTPVTLSFQIGGKQFPVDPRDFVSQNQTGDATTCIANNLVATDPPSRGAQFSWSLGDPFFKSNVVVFYYGNLTHPSVDPPKIGFLSTVPANASDLLKQAVQDAKKDGGNFESTVHVAPTASTATTISASRASAVSSAASVLQNNVVTTSTPSAPATPPVPTPTSPEPTATQSPSGQVSGAPVCLALQHAIYYLMVPVLSLLVSL